MCFGGQIERERERDTHTERERERERETERYERETERYEREREREREITNRRLQLKYFLVYIVKCTTTSRQFTYILILVTNFGVI